MTKRLAPWASMAILGLLAGAGCSSSETDSAASGGMAGATQSGGDATGGEDGGAKSCSSGQMNCGDACVDPLTSRDHCGTCGDACSVSETCVGGECVCGDGYESCAGSCVELESDPGHCGSCGNACEQGEVCSGGDCSAECDAGLSDCSGHCVDTTADQRHCGGCGQPCTGGAVCSGGECQSLTPPGDVPTGSWEPTEEKLGFDAQTVSGNKPSIAIGQDERPVIVVTRHDGTHNPSLEFWKHTGSGWEKAAPNINERSESVSFPNEARIAFDANDRLVVLFSEGSAACKFNTYARRLEGGAWSALGTESALKSNNCGELSLAVKGTDVYAMWQSSGGTPRHLIVKRFAGSAWEEVGSGGVQVPNQDDAVMGQALAVSSSGAPAVAWTGYPSELFVAEYEGGSWDPLYGAKGAGFDVALANLDGRPSTVSAERNAQGESVVRLRHHLASGSPQIGGDLELKHNDLGLWVTSGGVPVVMGIAASDDTVRVSGWDGSEWQAIGDPISDVARCTSGALSPKGVLWLACTDVRSFSGEPTGITVYSLVP